MGARFVRALAWATALVVVSSMGMARAASFLPADVTAEMTGTTDSDVQLTAAAELIIIDGTIAVIRLRNTSPPVSPLPDGPRLVRAGFNLAHDPGPSCLTFEDPTSRFELLTPAAPFCGGLHPFSYEVRATALEAGIRTTEALEMVLRVATECQDAFHFAPSTFTFALPGTVGDRAAQWGGQLDAVTDEPDGVCVSGDTELQIPTLLYTWATFIGSAAETRPSPSAFSQKDRRAGSLDVSLNGRTGFDGETNDPPLEAGIVTLRNGAGRVLEQQHLNRRWAPRYVEDDCVVWFNVPICFWYWPEDAVGDILAALTPMFVADSNERFDEEGDRVTVEGGLVLDYGLAPFGDNAHETATVTWTHPEGLDRAQLMLRGRYDTDLDGTNVDQPWIVLFARNTPAVPGGSRDSSVRVTSMSRNSLTIEIDVQAALESMLLDYVEAGVL